MMSGSRIYRIPFYVGIGLGLLWAPLFSFPQAQPQAQSSTSSFAETQHEIVLLLIKKKEFEKALEEACKIFQMQWPEEKEPELLKELRGFADQLLHNEQHAIAIRLLDKNLDHFKSNKSKASIWKEKGYLYKALGEDEMALDCFREAQRLEKK